MARRKKVSAPVEKVEASVAEVKTAAVEEVKPVPAEEVKAAAPAEVKAEVKAPAKASEKKTSAKAAEKKPAAEKKAPAKKAAASKKAEVTYWSIIDGLKDKVKNVKVSADVRVAAQVKIDGTAEGILYILVANGVAVVEPFDYKDADIDIIADADALAAVISGKKTISDVIADGSVKMQGNAGKAILLVSAVF
ncbi:MAG: SCP2 sterol-binding domain-containing protein [Huintestinicola sp.]